MWDVHHKGLPQCLMKILNVDKESKSSRNITHSNKYIPICRTKYKINSITTSGTVLWKNILDNIKDLKSKIQFTKTFKKHLNGLPQGECNQNVKTLSVLKLKT